MRLPSAMGHPNSSIGGFAYQRRLSPRKMKVKERFKTSDAILPMTRIYLRFLFWSKTEFTSARNYILSAFKHSMRWIHAERTKLKSFQ